MGEISFDGGFVSVRGSDNRCGSDPECGAFVQGTSDFGGGPARENLEADLHLADMAMIATTDYVAGASYHGSSSAADLRWAGPDGLVTTADDSFTQFLQVGSEKFVDDDASSLPDLNEPRTVPIALIPELDLSAGSPFDLVIADLLQTGDLDTSTTPGLDNASVDGEAWTQHDTDPGIPVTDGLPYAAAELDSAETTRIGFREYVDAGVRTFYELWLGSSLAASEYEFVLGRSGDSTPGEALSYAGVVDRYDDISSNRQVHNDVTWSGETLYIAADEVYPNEPGSNDFEGWVRITLPRIDTGTPIKAGESAPYPPGITITNDLEVEFWDAATKKYVSVFSGFSSMECAATSTTVTFTSEFGSPQAHSLALSGHPQITYEVDAEVTIRPYCPSYVLDSNGDVAQADVSLAQMVTGTVSYKVTDDLMEAVLGDGLMYDLAIDFDGGGVDTTALFVNPEAS